MNVNFFYVLLTVHLSIFILVINQLDAQNCCFAISLFHASTRSVSKVSVLIFYLNVYWTHLKLQVISFKV